MFRFLSIAVFFAFVFTAGIAKAQDSLFAPAVNYPVGTTPIYVKSGDIDGDGDVDLITSNASSLDISVLLNNGDGTFQDSVNYTVPQYPRGHFITDLDGDNDLDVAIVCPFSILPLPSKRDIL